MKKQTLLPLLAALIALPLHAQAVKESDLTPEEKTLLNFVRGKAGADASVKQATEVVRTTRIEVISKVDPTLQPFVNKIYPPVAISLSALPADEMAKWNAAAGKLGSDPAIWKASEALTAMRIEAIVKIDPSLEPLAKKYFITPSMPLTVLTPEEKTKWDAAVKASDSDPSIKQAYETLTKTRNEVMLKIDPNVKPILDKLYPPAPAQ
jgi:ABC-type cobalt transport system substrate-binding protein